jgi:hypothetical protein
MQPLAHDTCLLHWGVLSADGAFAGGRLVMDMTHPVDRMLRLWSVRPTDDEVAALSAFREVSSSPGHE